MIKGLEIGNKTSISKEVIPFVLNGLDSDGFALVSMPKSEKPETDMLVVSAVVGSKLAQDLSYHVITGEGDGKLAAHTEGIYYPSGIINFFALGCVIPSKTGGATRIFDGRIAARIITNTYPSLSGVEIKYSSLAHKDQFACHPILVGTENHGVTLRYRSNVVTNEISNKQGLTDDFVYKVIDEVLEDSVILTYMWSPGDLLFVNNQFTLHDRLPYSGARKMLRIRFDDPTHQRILY